jgi:hypothetical protein
MGFKITQQTISGGKTIYVQAMELATGGFTLDTSNLAAGTEVLAGSVMGFDEATRKAKVLKVAVLHANAADDATTYQVKKGHPLQVGDYIGVVVGGKAYAITEIDSTNADYDVLTVGTTLGVALTAADGVVLFQSSATGASACAYGSGDPKGLLYEDVKAEDNTSCGVLLRGTVYERRIPKIAAGVKAYLPNIIFSNSY